MLIMIAIIRTYGIPATAVAAVVGSLILAGGTFAQQPPPQPMGFFITSAGPGNGGQPGWSGGGRQALSDAGRRRGRGQPDLAAPT